MLTIYAGQTYTIAVTVYSPATLKKVNVSVMKLDVYSQTGGVWSAVEADLSFDENDGVGIYKKYHYFDPVKYTVNNQLLRIIAHWTLVLESGSKNDLEIKEVNILTAH